MKIKEETFIETYNDNNLSLRKIRRKLGLKHNEFDKIRNQLIQEGKIKPRTFKAPRKKPHIPKNYSFCNTTKNYQIRKNGVYFGCVKKEQEARKFVELLKEKNWDYDLKDELRLQAIKEVS